MIKLIQRWLGITELQERTMYSYEKHPLVNIPVKDMIDDNSHKCRLGRSELYNEIVRLEKKVVAMDSALKFLMPDVIGDMEKIKEAKNEKVW